MAFDRKAWARVRQKLERERDAAVNAAMARLSNRTPAGDLSVSDPLARSEANMADMLLVLEEVKRRVVEVAKNGRNSRTTWRSIGTG